MIWPEIWALSKRQFQNCPIKHIQVLCLFMWLFHKILLCMLLQVGHQHILQY